MIVLKGNPLVSFTHQKTLSGSHSHKINSKFLNEGPKPCGILPSSIIFLYFKTHNLIYNYVSISPNTRSCHTAPSSWTIFFFAGRHPKSFRAYIILPFCLPSTFYHSHHCIQHSTLLVAVCSHICLFL